MWYFFDLPLVAQIGFGVASVSLVILLSYYLLLFSKAIVKKEYPLTTSVPVSIIIAARNEKKNLEENLGYILKQAYPRFEVIVVNDSSFDETGDVLKEWSKKYEHLKIVTLDIDERFQKGKKFAITMGVKAAKHEYLIFTDADCKPTSENWISHMASALVEDKTEIVLGSSPLTTKRSILGSIVNYETFHTALQYFSYANKGMAYMGVGRNLGYTKSLFFKHKGFAAHQHILSGDDDLFVQQASTTNNVTTVTDENSHTLSEGPKNFKTWIRQKTRHLSTGKEYKTKYIVLLGLYSFAQVLFYIVLIALVIVYPSTWNLATALLFTKWITLWLVAYKPAKVLGYKRIGYAVPYYDVLYTLYLLLFSIIKPFVKTKTWI